MLRKPLKIDDYSAEYSFCPGKATWHEEFADLFQQCRVSLETGILPDSGSFQDQAELFVEVFPYFVQRWKERQYYRIWADVKTYVKDVAESLLGKK